MTWVPGSGPPPPRYDHLLRFTDDVGMLEHAMGALPRREHGYCTDDNARALIVVTRAEDLPQLSGLADRYLAFIRHAYRGGGQFLNRMEYDRTWDVRRGESLDDGCGRALWALGITAVHAREAHIRWAANEIFTDAAGFRPYHMRSAAFGAVGACEILAIEDHDGAEGLARYAIKLIDNDWKGPMGWVWPENYLSWANALLPHALISSGFVLNEDKPLQHGLEMLHWLVQRCTAPGGHLSVCPATGWTMDKTSQGGHQQPIEVSSFADAAAAAYEATTDPYWLDVMNLCVRWFLGENDGKTYMIDESSGGCYDGLNPEGVNPNQGAESCLALVSVMQHAHRISTLANTRSRG